ncbi:ATP-binding cassette domain-containing protein [Paenibacillus sp. LMG 31459]|uniref:ATP-binding cassette domain-containing protein n=1 Tax=Paenibacillus phytohabitans TaxID=2654978 RepID=A0ABX1YMC1_9BACL|nr:ABC transporter ATP-binding protein [Paenibacillus phytohabitans]NOU82195.1 ATP-binding cassette domain-containing protein [Paenibacillus phytohabitans]
MSILEITGVSKKYGSLHALKDITFAVEPGEWLSIMGSSGSGKSTMLNMIGLMDKPSSGQVKIDGIATSSMSSRKLTEIRKDKIGLVFQQFHLIPHLTALENVMVAQYYHSMPDEKEAAAALARVGLEGRARHLPRQLSGGEQQRVCIARALINYPALILADEPTGNLDEANEKIVLDLFQELHQEGHTIIMVTHAPEVGELAERQIRLEHGVIKEIRMPNKVVAVQQELVNN